MVSPARSEKQRAPRSRRAPLVVASAALIVFAWLAILVSRTGEAPFDAPIRAAVHAHSNNALTAAAHFLSAFGEPVVLTCLSVLVIVGFLLLRWRRAAAVFAFLIAGTLILDGSLKAAFHRPRPPVSFFGAAMPHSAAFPSGHSLFSVCFFVSLAVLIAPRLRRRDLRIALWTAACLLAFAIGLSRIYLGVHYPSDVLAGFAVAVAWIALVTAAAELA